MKGRRVAYRSLDLGVVWEWYSRRRAAVFGHGINSIRMLWNALSDKGVWVQTVDC